MAKIIEIEDFNAPELDIYARMSEAQLLNSETYAQGVFIAESPKVIERALDAGCKPISILVEKKHIQTQAADIIKRCGDINVFTAEFDVLTQLTGFMLTRGMLCAMYRPPLKTVEEIAKNAKRIAVLENIMNPTNVGAIFRSAAALNIDAVILTDDCSNPLYRRSIRVSMGTVFQIDWTIYSSEELSAVEKMKSLGFKIASMALNDNSVSIKNPALSAEPKLAIFLGSEGYGLKPETIENSDYIIKIPMSNNVDSLNVAAASALAFWELGNKSEGDINV
ncbi:MAG: RNA methyltransferase [Ruminococcus sp.]|nr:RNA methyltransferase [Candidatus Copronaster equi]